MVKIPTKLSEGTLSTQTTANQITDIASLTRTSVAIQRAGQKLETIAEEFKQLDNLRQITSATSGYNAEISEAEAKFLSDPNLSEKSIVDFQITEQEIRQRHLATIGDERSRLRTGLSLEGTGRVKSFNIKRQGRQADLDNFAVEDVAITGGFIKDYYAAGPTERSIIRGNFVIHQNNRLAARETTIKGKAEAIANFDETVRKGRARYWLEGLTAPGEGKTDAQRVEGAEKFIELLDAGEYSELDTGEEATLRNEAKNFIKRYTEIAKDVRDKKHRENFARDSDDILDEKISLEEMERKQVFEDEYSKSKVDQVKGYFKDFKSPRPEGDENISEWARLRKLDLGLLEKSVFIDAEGKELSEQESQKILETGGKVPKGITVIQRRVTNDEYEADVLGTINGNLSTATGKRLLNNRYGAIDTKEAQVYKREFENLESRMKVIRLQQFNTVTGLFPEETPAEIQSQIDLWTNILDKRVSEIENPTEAQMVEIAEDVFQKWRVADPKIGGAGQPDNATDIQLMIGGIFNRAFTSGKVESEKKPDLTLQGDGTFK